MDKITLDKILEKYKAQPVGHGYIDIIVSRDNYKNFVSELVTSGFKIDSVSWWEWCEGNKETEYGLGGPESIFYQGWFSEIPVNVDDFNFSAKSTEENIVQKILNEIEAKKISFSEEIITFKESDWLTPAFWLDGTDDWRNSYNT